MASRFATAASAAMVQSPAAGRRPIVELAKLHDASSLAPPGRQRRRLVDRKGQLLQIGPGFLDSRRVDLR